MVKTLITILGIIVCTAIYGQKGTIQTNQIQKGTEENQILVTDPSSYILNFQSGQETIDDFVSNLIQPGTDISVVYDDVSNTLTISYTGSAGPGLWTESGGSIYPTTLSNSVGIKTSSPNLDFHVDGAGIFSENLYVGYEPSVTDIFLFSVVNDSYVENQGGIDYQIGASITTRETTSVNVDNVINLKLDDNDYFGFGAETTAPHTNVLMSMMIDGGHTDMVVPTSLAIRIKADMDGLGTVNSAKAISIFDQLDEGVANVNVTGDYYFLCQENAMNNFLNNIRIDNTTNTPAHPTYALEVNGGVKLENLTLDNSAISILTETAGVVTKTDLTAIQDGTGSDDQNISGSSFNSSTGEITIGIEDGTGQTFSIDGRYLITEAQDIEDVLILGDDANGQILEGLGQLGIGGAVIPSVGITLYDDDIRIVNGSAQMSFNFGTLGEMTYRANRNSLSPTFTHLWMNEATNQMAIYPTNQLRLHGYTSAASFPITAEGVLVYNTTGFVGTHDFDDFVFQDDLSAISTPDIEQVLIAGNDANGQTIIDVGKVVIGKTTSLHELEAHNSSGVASIAVSTPNLADARYHLLNSENSYFIGVNVSGDIEFIDETDSDATIMYFEKGSQFVGINQSTASTELDVNGTIRGTSLQLETVLSAGSETDFLVLEGEDIKQRDLSTVISNANTAFGWGDHSVQGYYDNTTWSTHDIAFTGNRSHDMNTYYLTLNGNNDNIHRFTADGYYINQYDDGVNLATMHIATNEFGGYINMTTNHNLTFQTNSTAHFQILSSGYIRANDYGTGGNTVTPTYIPAFDLNGIVGEIDYDDFVFESELSAATHDPVTLDGTLDYLTLAAQVITLNQLDLTTDVTGILPIGNIEDDLSLFDNTTSSFATTGQVYWELNGSDIDSKDDRDIKIENPTPSISLWDSDDNTRIELESGQLAIVDNLGSDLIRIIGAANTMQSSSSFTFGAGSGTENYGFEMSSSGVLTSSAISIGDYDFWIMQGSGINASSDDDYYSITFTDHDGTGFGSGASWQFLETGGIKINADEGTYYTLPDNAGTDGYLVYQNGSDWDYIDPATLAGGQWDRDAGSGYIYPSTLTDRVGIGLNNPSTGLHYKNNSAIFTIQDGNGSSGVANTFINFNDLNNANVAFLGYFFDDKFTISQLATKSFALQFGSVDKFNVDNDGTITINQEYSLPILDGEAGQALITDGFGAVSFQDISATDTYIGNTDQTATGNRIFDLNTYDLQFTNGDIGIRGAAVGGVGLTVYDGQIRLINGSGHASFNWDSGGEMTYRADRTALGTGAHAHNFMTGASTNLFTIYNDGEIRLQEYGTGSTFDGSSDTELLTVDASGYIGLKSTDDFITSSNTHFVDNGSYLTVRNGEDIAIGGDFDPIGNVQIDGTGNVTFGMSRSDGGDADVINNFYKFTTGSAANVMFFDDGYLFVISPSNEYGYNGVDYANAIVLRGSTMSNGGYVGIGKSAAQEKLDVNGAIKIGTTTNTNNGTIRFTGSDFEGRISGAWESLTSSGGGADGNGIYDGSGSLTANTTITTAGFWTEFSNGSGSYTRIWDDGLQEWVSTGSNFTIDATVSNVVKLATGTGDDLVFSVDSGEDVLEITSAGIMNFTGSNGDLEFYNTGNRIHFNHTSSGATGETVIFSSGFFIGTTTDHDVILRGGVSGTPYARIDISEQEFVIHEDLVVEGEVKLPTVYASFLNTSSTTTVGTTPTTLVINGIKKSKGGALAPSLNGATGEITINKTSEYRLHVDVTFNNTSGSTRTSVQTDVYINGVLEEGFQINTYHRQQDHPDTGTAFLILDLEDEDVITIRSHRTTGTGPIDSVEDGVRVTLEEKEK